MLRSRYSTVCLPGAVLDDAVDELARDSRGALLFDFGGTLDADGVRWSLRFHGAYARLGGRLDAEAFEPIFRASDRQLEALDGVARLGLRAMMEAQAGILCRLLPDGTAIDAGAVAGAVHADSVRTIARNRSVLEGLRRSHRLAVVSNFTGNLAVCLDELELAHLFDVVTDSAVLGVSKPDRRAFRHTLAALDVPASRAWMIGDNPEADIRPALGLGMRAVWLAPAVRTAPPGCAPTARIASLAELPAVLAPLAGGAPLVSQCTG